MYYTPQPIPVYTAKEMQQFRKGNCQPYENRILVNGNTWKMPNVMLKRETDGVAVTATLVTLEDADAITFTIPSQTDWPLDDPLGDYEMRVLNAGNWTTGTSQSEQNYYIRFEAGANTWYSESIYVEQTSATFPQCSDGWVKLTWTDGRCIVSGYSTDGTTPVLAYPDNAHSFFIYLRASLSRPDWDYEEEGDKDAFGVFNADHKRQAKRWKLEGYPVNEAVIDALVSSTLFESVSIAFPSMPGFADIKDIKVLPKWEVGGCFATFEYSFTTDFLLKQGCC